MKKLLRLIDVSVNGKQPLQHKIGNIIQGFISMIDGIILIISLGFLTTNWVTRFVFFRLDGNLYQRNWFNKNK